MLILLQGFKIEPIAIEGLVILKKSFHSTPPPPLQIVPLCYTFIFLYTLYIYIYILTHGGLPTPPSILCLSVYLCGKECWNPRREGGEGGGCGLLKDSDSSCPPSSHPSCCSLQWYEQHADAAQWYYVICIMYMYYVSSLHTQLFWTLLPYIGAL